MTKDEAIRSAQEDAANDTRPGVRYQVFRVGDKYCTEQVYDTDVALTIRERLRGELIATFPEKVQA